MDGGRWGVSVPFPQLWDSFAYLSPPLEEVTKSAINSPQKWKKMSCFSLRQGNAGYKGNLPHSEEKDFRTKKESIDSRHFATPRALRQKGTLQNHPIINAQGCWGSESHKPHGRHIGGWKFHLPCPLSQDGLMAQLQAALDQIPSQQSAPCLPLCLPAMPLVGLPNKQSDCSSMALTFLAKGSNPKGTERGRRRWKKTRERQAKTREAHLYTVYCVPTNHEPLYRMPWCDYWN